MLRGLSLGSMILLVGGSSNVGKTTVGQDLARAGYEHVEIDQLRRLKPSLFPDVDEAFSAPRVSRTRPDTLFAALTEATQAMAPAITEIVERRLADPSPAIIEGEGIEPRLMLRLPRDPRLRPVFVVETDEERLHSTLVNRQSPGAARYRSLTPNEQRTVLTINRMYGEWLQAQAADADLPSVPVHPWESLASRVLAAAEQ